LQEEPPVNVEDRLAIDDLYARICVALDTGDAAGWVSLFTEDAVFERHVTVRGHAELLEFIRGRIAARATDPIARPQHWTTNLVLSGEPPEVRGFCYLMKVGRPRDGGPAMIASVAVYRDVLRKVDGRWLVGRRRVSAEVPAADQVWAD
jgi:hypothetical protein